MRTALIAVLAGTLVTAWGCADDPEALAPPAPGADAVIGSANVEEQVTGIVKDWLDAVEKRDTARIDRILSDDFQATLPNGETTTKATHIEDLRSGTYTVVSIALEDTKSRVFGDTAFVTYTQTEKSQSLGSDSSGRTAWTDVLLNRNGRWQIVAEYGSRLD